MSPHIIAGRPARFTVGWLLLLIAAALMALNHTVLIFALDEPILFTGYAVFNLYALVVLAIPFRRREPWAWYTTGLLPLGLSVPAAIDPPLAPFYFSVAALCVLGMLLTIADFFPRDARRIAPPA